LRGGASSLGTVTSSLYDDFKPGYWRANGEVDCPVARRVVEMARLINPELYTVINTLDVPVNGEYPAGFLSVHVDGTPGDIILASNTNPTLIAVDGKGSRLFYRPASGQVIRMSGSSTYHLAPPGMQVERKKTKIIGPIPT
jgi:hypothetical protein